MPRNRRRHLSDADFIHALQDLRLRGLETGTCEPLSDRETFYLRLFRDGRCPDRADFILSRPLLLLESMQIRAEREDEAGEPSPFTPTSEPAIPPE